MKSLLQAALRRHHGPDRLRALQRGADRPDLRGDKIQGRLRAEHGRLSALPRGVRVARGVCVLQDGRRPQKLKGNTAYLSWMIDANIEG